MKSKWGGRADLSSAISLYRRRPVYSPSAGRSCLVGTGYGVFTARHIFLSVFVIPSHVATAVPSFPVLSKVYFIISSSINPRPNNLPSSVALRSSHTSPILTSSVTTTHSLLMNLHFVVLLQPVHTLPFLASSAVTTNSSLIFLRQLSFNQRYLLSFTLYEIVQPTHMPPIVVPLAPA